jgi:prevent-host-death family protein
MHRLGGSVVMKTVSAREANQQFSKLLNEVAAGEAVVITRRGRPVATLAPYRGRPMTPEREKALEELLAMARKGFHLGGLRVNREELYDRCL